MPRLFLGCPQKRDLGGKLEGALGDALSTSPRQRCSVEEERALWLRHCRSLLSPLSHSLSLVTRRKKLAAPQPVGWFPYGVHLRGTDTGAGEAQTG
jgi:hypothetical protein